MDSLRLILLLVGVAIVGLIFAWESIKRRRKSQRYQRWGANDDDVSETHVITDSVVFPDEVVTPTAVVQSPAEPEQSAVVGEYTDSDVEIIDVNAHASISVDGIDSDEPDLDSDPLESITDELEALEQLIADEDPRSGQLEMPELKSEPEISDADRREAFERKPDRVIALNVISRSGDFDGASILEYTMNNDLYFSDMGIFHKRSNRKKDIFSMANALEPGTFDIHDMENFSTSCLLFFMTLPNPEAPLDAFDAMLAMAEELARDLNGKLCDETRSVLTRQGIETIREELGIYSMKQSELAI